MNIQPVLNVNSRIKTKQTQFERNSNLQNSNKKHNYTGIASVDLAYVSLYNEAIAKDLKLMGLI